MKIGIIGGGLGGLCLAQGLQKAGIEVAVYERDASQSARTQGYRIHISPQGSAALHDCLPGPLWEIFDATVGDFSQGFTIMTEQQQELLRIDMGKTRTDPVWRHRSVSRITLRHILLAGLESVVHFSKKFVKYETSPSGVTARFEDGDCAEADLLVGADGVHSRVRGQFLPGAEPVDTGVVGIGGTIPLTERVMERVPAQLGAGPAIVLPPTQRSLFLVMWRRAPGAARPLRQLGLEEADPGDADYLLMALGGPRQSFALNGTDTPGEEELRGLLRESMAGWHPAFRELATLLPPGQLFLNRIRTSRPPEAWPTTRITLLGDAIHSMTPYRGIGGNIALRDAALLCSQLEQAAAGRKPLLEAIHDYEAAMRQYAFAAVNESLRAMRQFNGPKRQPWFSLMKFGMRAANWRMRRQRLSEQRKPA